MYKYTLEKKENGYAILINNKYYDFYPTKESAEEMIGMLERSDKNHSHWPYRLTDLL